MPIGKRLSDLLTAKSENVNSISNRIGVSPQTIYSIIKRDNMKVDFDVLIKLSRALNVSVEYFYEPQISQRVDTVPTSEEGGDKDIFADELMENYKALNRDGRRKLIDYSKDLVSGGRYTAIEEDVG